MHNTIYKYLFIYFHLLIIILQDLLSMFKEVWSDSRSQSNEDFNHESDPFMRSFQAHVSHFHNSILRKLTPCPTLSTYVQVREIT